MLQFSPPHLRCPIWLPSCTQLPTGMTVDLLIGRGWLLMCQYEQVSRTNANATQIHYRYRLLVAYSFVLWKAYNFGLRLSIIQNYTIYNIESTFAQTCISISETCRFVADLYYHGWFSCGILHLYSVKSSFGTGCSGAIVDEQ